MNWEKTDVMKVGKEGGHCCVEVGAWQEVGIGEGSQVSWVMISKDGRRKRSGVGFGKAARVIRVLSELVWKRKELSRRTKLRVYTLPAYSHKLQ